MSALLENIENEFRVSHRVVAGQTDNLAKNIFELINKYKIDFDEFGYLPFKTEKTTNTDLGNGRPSKTYYLNEQQATFLMTLLRNSPKVVIFKKALVKAFYELKEKVASKATQIEESYFEKIYFPHQVINIHDPDFRRVLYIAYGGKCFYTNEPLNKNDFHIDHIMPKSKGGKDTVANCVPCIPEYNMQKSDNLLPNSQNIIEAVLSCHADIVIELFNNIKTAKSLKSKHNRVSMQGLKKSIMKEFNEMYGEKVMALFYAEVFGIPYSYNDYEDQTTVLEFIKYSLVNVNEIEKREDFTTETYIYKRYKEYCLSKGNKVLRVYDFLGHLQDYLNVKEGISKDDNEKIIRTFNVKIKD